METLGNNSRAKKGKKGQQEYVCETCDFVCSKKYSWERHIATAKHKMETNGNISGAKKGEKGQETNTTFLCENCNKEFQHRSGLWKHKKKCLETQCETANCTVSSTNDREPTPTPEILSMLMQQNKDIQNMMLEVIKNGTHTTNTTISNNNNSNNNNNNKTFNLQFFLNETCKDAMNLMDFVKDIVLTLNDLEETGRIGFAEGISKMINKRLKALDITQRPIHCSDLKRETLYIKNENKWEKETDDKPILTNAVKHIAGKNMMQIFDWQKAHPDYNDPETRTSDKYMKMLTNVMSGGTEEEIQENYDKIIKNIIKESAIIKDNFLI